MEKTCGNCGHSKPYKMIEAPIGSYVLCPDAGEVIEADWSDVCDEWVPKTVSQAFAEGFDEGLFKLQYEQLEQRYQQLEQVAQEMLRLLKNIEREYTRLLDPNRKSGGQIVYPMPSDEYANQLEELGVEL